MCQYKNKFKKIIKNYFKNNLYYNFKYTLNKVSIGNQLADRRLPCREQVRNYWNINSQEKFNPSTTVTTPKKTKEIKNSL